MKDWFKSQMKLTPGRSLFNIIMGAQLTYFVCRWVIQLWYATSAADLYLANWMLTCMMLSGLLILFENLNRSITKMWRDLAEEVIKEYGKQSEMIHKLLVDLRATDEAMKLKETPDEQIK